MIRKPHISVCICTFKRSALLGRTLQELVRQKTNDEFTFSLLVVDNDAAGSSRKAVEDFAEKSPISIRYEIQPVQNISRARNTAVANASGDFIAFIDDDELPIVHWLHTLFTECLLRGVDGILGPVKPHFDEPPPRWIVKGGFYDRPSYSTGLVIDYTKGRTGNVLLKRAVFEGEPEPFNPAFITGEDQDFFRRMIMKGHIFIWCDEALAYEVVPPSRWRRSFMLRRALLRGKIRVKGPKAGFSDAVKSLFAVISYLFMLPVTIFVGHHVFMNYLIRAFDHGGKLLAHFGLNRMEEKYITE